MYTSKNRKQFKIYGPGHFSATWAKFIEICERDGTNASREIRAFVEGQVARREPGNPQRPITAFVEGHEDEAAARRSDLLKALIAKAQVTGGELRRREVLQALKDQGAVGNRLVVLTKSMVGDLEKLGVKIVYHRGAF